MFGRSVTSGFSPNIRILPEKDPKEKGLPHGVVPFLLALFLYFTVFGLLFAPFTVFFELDFTLHSLAVFPAPVIDAFALLTG